MKKNPKWYPLPPRCRVDLLEGMQPSSYEHRLWVGWSKTDELPVTVWRLQDSRARAGLWYVSRDGYLARTDVKLSKDQEAQIQKLLDNDGWEAFMGYAVEFLGGEWANEGDTTITSTAGCVGVRATAWRAAQMLSNYVGRWPNLDVGWRRTGKDKPDRTVLDIVDPDWLEWYEQLGLRSRQSLAIEIMRVIDRKLEHPGTWARWRRFTRPGWMGVIRPLCYDSWKPHGRKHPSSAVQLLGRLWLTPEGEPYQRSLSSDAALPLL